MTSPEPRDSPERLSSPGDSNSNGENGEEQLDISVTKERKTSGGFFAKRFGITKMKDHSTKKDRLIDTNSANNSPMEFKPLKVGLVKITWHSIATLPPPLVKTAESNVILPRQSQVPAVFRLLRPEFREQLKQSSCKVIFKKLNFQNCTTKLFIARWRSPTRIPPRRESSQSVGRVRIRPPQSGSSRSASSVRPKME